MGTVPTPKGGKALHKALLKKLWKQVRISKCEDSSLLDSTLKVRPYPIYKYTANAMHNTRAQREHTHFVVTARFSVGQQGGCCARIAAAGIGGRRVPVLCEGFHHLWRRHPGDGHLRAHAASEYCALAMRTVGVRPLPLSVLTQHTREHQPLTRQELPLIAYHSPRNTQYSNSILNTQNSTLTYSTKLRIHRLSLGWDVMMRWRRTSWDSLKANQAGEVSSSGCSLSPSALRTPLHTHRTVRSSHAWS